MGYLGLTPTQNQKAEIPQENLIINGFFDIWQRGDSQTSEGYGSADRWHMTLDSAEARFEKGYFTSDGTPAGTYDSQGVTKNPKYFLRTIISSIIDIQTSLVMPMTRLQIAYKSANEKININFWAKASSNKNTKIEIIRENWSGSISSKTFQWNKSISLTSEWQQFNMSIDMDTLDGVTIPTNGMTVSLSFTFSSPDLNISGQTGVFDIASVEMYTGSDNGYVMRKSGEEELEDCLRYYETGIEKYSLWAIYSSTNAAMNQLTFKVPKTKIPEMSYDSLGVGKGATGITFLNMNAYGSQVSILGSGMPIDEAGHITFNWQADAEI